MDHVSFIQIWGYQHSVYLLSNLCYATELVFIIVHQFGSLPFYMKIVENIMFNH